ARREGGGEHGAGAGIGQRRCRVRSDQTHTEPPYLSRRQVRLWVVDRCAKQGDVRSGGASPGPRLAQQPQRYPVWFSRQGENSPLRPIPLALRWRRGKGGLRAAHSAVNRVAENGRRAN